ncbi:MAG: dihydrofolate reductase [Pseudomonadota bacterium]|nr:dihydrofolate reductase [Pseudomonadota bacterium]
MKVALIVAMAENGVIGKDNTMPWHIPEELQYFKSVTMGKPIIMGRNTWESLGKALPGRMNIVITTQHDYDAKDAVVVDSLETAMEVAKYQAQNDEVDEIMVIGGANVYEQALPLAQRVYLTHVHLLPEGDRFFPSLKEGEFACLESTRHESKTGVQYSTEVYEKQ